LALEAGKVLAGVGFGPHGSVKGGLSLFGSPCCVPELGLDLARVLGGLRQALRLRGQLGPCALRRSGPLASGRFESFVGSEVEQLREDFFALVGSHGGEELVCASLEEEGGVHERAVVHAQNVPDVLVGLPDGVLGDVRPAFGGHDLEADYVALGGALPGLRALPMPHDLIRLCVELEREVDDALVGAFADQALLVLSVLAAAGGAEEGVGHRVEQRALANSVVAGETGDIEASEVDRVGCAVRQEVAHLEPDGNHASTSSMSSRPRRMSSSRSAGVSSRVSR
jgi:hypothetical protein